MNLRRTAHPALLASVVLLAACGGDSGSHEAWFENTQSVVAKVALVRKHGLAGVAMWRMGHEDLDFWVAARTGLD